MYDQNYLCFTYCLFCLVFLILFCFAVYLSIYKHMVYFTWKYIHAKWKNVKAAWQSWPSNKVFVKVNQILHGGFEMHGGFLPCPIYKKW